MANNLSVACQSERRSGMEMNRSGVYLRPVFGRAYCRSFHRALDCEAVRACPKELLHEPELHEDIQQYYDSVCSPRAFSRAIHRSFDNLKADHLGGVHGDDHIVDGICDIALFHYPVQTPNRGVSFVVQGGRHLAVFGAHNVGKYLLPWRTL